MTAPDCQTAQEQVRRFASGNLPASEHRSLRAHCQDCAECAELFQSVAGTLARLGHERRILRDAEVKARRSHELRRDVFEAQDSRRFRHARLRSMVYPAFFVALLLLIFLPALAPGGAKVLAQTPGVWVRGIELVGPGAGGKLRSGERLGVTDGGRAELHTAGTVWVLHGGSELRLDSAARKATHFYAGDLAVAGPFECFTSLGVLRSKDDQARCELSLRDGTLRVSCLAGSARWTDALGQVELTAGESLER